MSGEAAKATQAVDKSRGKRGNIVAVNFNVSHNVSLFARECKFVADETFASETQKMFLNRKQFSFLMMFHKSNSAK